MSPRTKQATGTPRAVKRAALIATLGMEVVRFQDATNDVDDAAAAVLALPRVDLQAISLLLFQGAASVSHLSAALRLGPRVARALVERLELAGYARRVPAPVAQKAEAREPNLELTEHARRWVDTIWGPLQVESTQLLAQQSSRDLAVLVRFMAAVRPVQEAHATRIRALLHVPGQGLAANRRRGGLSPAALRRVQLFVEANLERVLKLADLAERADLSPYHFARAFKTSMGCTPRAFIEQRRIHQAQQLLRRSELSLSQVAEQTGLGSQSRFTTTFRRATSFTPAAYRRGA